MSKKLNQIFDTIKGVDENIIETAAYASSTPEATVLDFLKDKLNEEQYIVLQEELSSFLQETAITVPPSFFNSKVEGDFIYDTFTGKEFRGGEKLTFDIIERMKRSGVVMFPLEMKRASLMHVFRNPRKWKVVCQDEPLRKIARANLEQILPKMADEFTFSAMVYGSSFAELTAKLTTEDQLGMPVTPGPKRVWTVFTVPKFVNPVTVKYIKRTSKGRFDGFVQFRRNNTALNDLVVEANTATEESTDIVVPKERSLLVPYQDKFGDLWGTSFFKTVYPYWFWFEVITRAMVRYMERMSSPVAVARAPARRKVRVPGSDKLQDAMLWALGIARDIATSNAAVLPSDPDPATGKEAWSIEYLTAPERSQNFKDVLEMLQELIFRASNSGDRAFTQSSGGTGSFNQAEVHEEATATHNEMILIGFLWYINAFFMPKYSEWNLGIQGAPVRLETVALSSRERVLMNKLLSVAGNSATVQEFFHIIDWRTLAEDEGIPTFTQEEVQANKERLLQESIANELERQRTGVSQNNNNASASGTSGFGVEADLSRTVEEVESGEE